MAIKLALSGFITTRTKVISPGIDDRLFSEQMHLFVT